MAVDPRHTPVDRDQLGTGLGLNLVMCIPNLLPWNARAAIVV